MVLPVVDDDSARSDFDRAASASRSLIGARRSGFDAGPLRCQAEYAALSCAALTHLAPTPSTCGRQSLHQCWQHGGRIWHAGPNPHSLPECHRLFPSEAAPVCADDDPSQLPASLSVVRALRMPDAKPSPGVLSPPRDSVRSNGPARFKAGQATTEPVRANQQQGRAELSRAWPRTMYAGRKGQAQQQSFVAPLSGALEAEAGSRSLSLPVAPTQPRSPAWRWAVRDCSRWRQALPVPRFLDDAAQPDAGHRRLEAWLAGSTAPPQTSLPRSMWFAADSGRMRAVTRPSRTAAAPPACLAPKLAVRPDPGGLWIRTADKKPTHPARAPSGGPDHRTRPLEVCPDRRPTRWRQGDLACGLVTVLSRLIGRANAAIGHSKPAGSLARDFLRPGP